MILGEGVEAENIIVIMNEAFSDLRVVGNQGIKGDYMPFFDSLNNNVIKGNLYVPVFASGTCNTEFEVLTGVSCACVPGVPYQTYINQEINALPHLLREKGFSTIAFHPYYAGNWNRNLVYPRLGFDKYRTEVKDPEIIRWCVSDKSDYKVLIEEYEKKDKKKLFLFNVTMQNHGGYESEWDDFQSSVDLSEYGKYNEAEMYLSLVKGSDKALEYLVNYFKEVPEPTLICFFGDHQPGIEPDFYEKLYGKQESGLSNNEKQQKYITPFFIWANYDIEEEYIEKVSANYLSALILKTAGRDLSGYEAFLYRLYEKYPVISTSGIWDQTGNYYEELTRIEDKDIDKYIMLQYYMLYGD